jgi:hypothetical protein
MKDKSTEVKEDKLTVVQEDNPTNRELWWRQYNVWVELYKYHLELILKANAFFYFIAGGILTFYFAHPELPIIKWSLLLPALMGLALTGAFSYGAWLVHRQSKDFVALASKLNFAMVPDAQLLKVYLLCSALIFLVVGLSLITIISVR